MRQRNSFCTFYAASIFAVSLLVTLPCLAQNVLYDNGPDGNIGYYHVNFGSAVANSFVLAQPAVVKTVAFTVYTVDDRNTPESVKWSITTEPFGGTVLAGGFTSQYGMGDPYLTQFLFFAWKRAFDIPSVSLPAGTYYLQIQDVITRWDTFAFWAQSGGGPSAGYYEAIAQNGEGTVSPVPSESFAIYGHWAAEQAR